LPLLVDCHVAIGCRWNDWHCVHCRGSHTRRLGEKGRKRGSVPLTQAGMMWRTVVAARPCATNERTRRRSHRSTTHDAPLTW
jgi:hypothetical protein